MVRIRKFKTKSLAKQYVRQCKKIGEQASKAKKRKGTWFVTVLFVIA